MKKLVTWMLVVAITGLFTLAGCPKKEETAKPKPTPVKTTTQPAK